MEISDLETQGVNMALRAAESDEDGGLPAPNRDCQGADIFNGEDINERMFAGVFNRPFLRSQR
jgi:hypothetical protein